MIRKFFSLFFLLIFMLGSFCFVPEAQAAVKRKVTYKKAVKKKSARTVRKRKILPAPQLEPAPIPKSVPMPIKTEILKPAPPATYIGGSVGMLSSNQTGLLGFVQIPDPMGLAPMMGVAAVDWKVGAMYGQGKDGNVRRDLKIVVLFVDGILKVPMGRMPGLNTYVGGGLNYVVYRSGKASGIVGGEIYLGAEGQLFKMAGKQFVEIGYGILRAGSPYASNKGFSLVVGYKAPYDFEF